MLDSQVWFGKQNLNTKYTYIGAISDPCCIRLPTVNHNEFLKLNWLTRNSGSSMHGYGFVHSAGLNLPIIKKLKETKMKETANNIHTSMENGKAKVNKLGGAGSGFLNNMLIPKNVTIIL